MKRLLVPVDFSDVTARVLAAGITIARAFGAEVIVLHVAPPEPEFIGYEPGPQSVRDQVAHALHAEHKQLAELERQVVAQGLRCNALLVQGYPVEKILSEMQRQSADMLIMGSHGRGALRHLLVGSVTDGVLRQSACPVLVVPAA